MADTDIKTRYAERYAKQDNKHLYPVEFVVRAFLGTYPELTLDRSTFSGSNILDLGFGDGRNMPLLHNLGFRIHGVEIDEEIARVTQARITGLGIQAVLKTGSNTRIPFESDFFHYVLACHSCYYVEDGTTYKDNLHEIHRVTKKNGVLVCSLPMRDTYLLEGAEKVGKGQWRIRHDPYGLRVGTLFRAFENQAEIESELRPLFDDFKIGFCDDLYWGIRQKVWIVVCTKQ